MPNPFPTPIAIPGRDTRLISSIDDNALRTNLDTSTAFYGFTLAAASPVALQVKVTAGGGDLTMKLESDVGHVIRSVIPKPKKIGSKAQIVEQVPAGRYVVEIDSFTEAGNRTTGNEVKYTMEVNHQLDRSF